MSKEYVSRIDEACIGGGDLIVILKYDKKDEAIKKILEKCRIKHKFSEIGVRGEYMGKEVNVFVTGKLLIKGLKGKREGEQFIKELLK